MKHNKSVFVAVVAMLVLLTSCSFNDPNAAKVQEIYDEVMKPKVSTAEYVEAHGGNAAELTSAGTEAGGTIGADNEAPLVNNEGTETAVLDNGNTASELQNSPTNSDNPNEQKTTETAASSPAGNTGTSPVTTDTSATNTSSLVATNTPATGTSVPTATAAPAPTATPKPATTTSTPAPTATTKPAATSAPTPTAAAAPTATAKQATSTPVPSTTTTPANDSATEWVTVQEPTCTTPGWQTRHINRDGWDVVQEQMIPATGHNWVTETVSEEQGHYESQQTGTRTVVDSEGWNEHVPGYYECLRCGQTFANGEDVADHCAEEGGGYHYVYSYDIWHPASTHEEAVYEDVWVVDTPASTRTYCSVCGAVKIPV